MNPIVLHAHGLQCVGEHCDVVSVAQRWDGGRAATLQLDHKPMLLASEWVALQPLVQRIHEDNEEQRSEWVPLAHAAEDCEVASEPKSRSNARGQSCEAVCDQGNKSSRHAMTVHRAHKHRGLHGVIRLFDVVEECVELMFAFAAPVPSIE